MRYNRQAEYNRRPYNAVGQTLMAPVVDISVKGTVSASAEVYLPTSLKTGGTVSRDLSQKMFTAKVRYDKAVTGGIYSGVFFKNVELAVPDHNGVSRVIFVGFYPSQTAHLEPGGSREEFTAYDYGWYLSDNPLDDDQLALRKPSEQDTGNYQRLDFDYVVNNFTVGKTIRGAVSGAQGQIVATQNATQNTWLYSSAIPPESYLVPASAIILSNITDAPFQDNERITEIGGAGDALVNGGAFIPLDFGPGAIYPETWIARILGGANWENTTGIYPYRINPVNPSVVTWTQLPYENWFWQSSVKKQQAHDEISEYYNFIWLLKWKQIPGYNRYLPCAYWVHQDDIDNPDNYVYTEHRGLSLPTPVTISNPDPYLVGSVEVDINGTARKNRVRVRGQDMQGIFYENARVPDIPGTPAGTATESAGVYYGEEKPSLYLDENPKLSTQALCQERAALLYAYLSLQISTWKATFRQRTDFELLQKLIFSGYPSSEIPDGDYRIISIEYPFEPVRVFVNVTLIRVDQFAAQLKINRVYTNAYLEMARVIKSEQAKEVQDQIGKVIGIVNGIATVQTESGPITITRNPE